MQRIVDFLAPLGFLVILAPQLALRFGQTVPGRPDAYWIAGGVLILAHVFLRWEDIVARLGRRQVKYGANAVVLALAGLALLGAVNYLVVRNSKRWDLTKNQRYSLSDQTRKIAASLKDDVTIWYFQRSVEMQAGEDRLKQYQGLSTHIKVNYVDPLKEPARAQQYEARGPYPVVVVERGNSREKISSDSEQELTNALIKVTRDGKKTVCFVEGEGEKDIDDSGDRGFSAAKLALEKSQYQTRKVLLMREGKVPDDCKIVALTGPEKDLLPQAIDAIRGFVKAGGKALVMVEPDGKDSYPNIAGLLKDWNIEAGRDVVVDVSPIGQLFGTGPLTPLASQYPFHEITRDFRLATAFHTARTMATGSGSVEGVTTQNLLETSQASWGESDLSLKEPIELNQGKDKQGPVSLGAVATLQVADPTPLPSPSPSASPSDSAAQEGDKEESEEPAKKPEGRVVALGDSDFASNALLGFQGNQDFFLNTVAWLSEDTDLISIRAREPDDQRMFLTAVQQRNVAYLALVILPGLFVVLGIATWWRRR